MNEVLIGEMIKKERQAQGLTQQALCEGICEVSTLSRLENGQSAMSIGKLRALMRRLGLPEDRVYAFLSEDDIRIGELERELVNLHILYEHTAAAEKSAARQAILEKQRELAELAGEGDQLIQQAILRSKYLIGTENGPYGLEEGKELLLKAIRLTSPRFQLDSISLGLYSENEVKLINSMATLYERNGDPDEAIYILRQLFNYLETNLRRTPKDRTQIPLVAFNYSRELGILGRYDKAIAVARRGQAVCSECGNYRLLPDLLAVMAECYYRKNELDESAELYQEAFYIYKAIGNEHDKKIIQAEAKERLGLDLK